MQKNKKKQIMIRLFILLVIFCSFLYANASFADQEGINFFKAEVVSDIDNAVNVYRSQLNYALVGVVYGGEVVLTKSYIIDDVERISEWASISKPATAMIVMQLVEEGYITDIDDNIWDYAPKYIDCMPFQYSNSDLTIRHLLIHQSGLNYAAPLWSGDYLDFMFEPGTDIEYSSGSYGIIGDVIRAVTGKGYNTLVEEYIGGPVGGGTITAREQNDALAEVTYSDWQSPASYISSNIKDIAEFSAGIINNEYVTPDVLYNEILQDYGEYHGIGWMVYYDPYQYALHTGNNGSQRSVMIIDLDNNLSISILFSGDVLDERITWAQSILEVLYSYPDPLLGITPPSRSNPQPTGTLSSGTAQATISLSTNKTATCKYSETAGTDYDSIPNTFSNTNSTSHSQTITGLSDGNTYTYYVRCEDAAATPNQNINDFTISFSIDSLTTYGILDFAQLVIEWLWTSLFTVDINDDGIVNTRDLGIMMSNWQE